MFYDFFAIEVQRILMLKRLIPIFEVELEYFCTCCEKYSSKFDVYRSLHLYL